MNILGIASRFPGTFLILAFLIYLYSGMRKTDNRIEKKRQDFWDREREANSTRRKPLDDVNFIQIPYEQLPIEIETEDECILGCIHDLELLRNDKIANFTGKTNTDLKLQYGAPNITQLMRYDGNFTHLCRVLQDWSGRLYELEHMDEALKVAEFAISIHSDISATFYLCADIYDIKRNELNQMEDTVESTNAHCQLDDKISNLKTVARALDSAIAPSIIRTLDERYPDIPAKDIAI